MYGSEDRSHREYEKLRNRGLVWGMRGAVAHFSPELIASNRLETMNPGARGVGSAGHGPRGRMT